MFHNKNMPKTSKPLKKVHRRRRRGAANVNKLNKEITAVNPTMSVYTQNIGLPLKKRVLLTYYHTQAFASAGVAHAGYQFRMNSIEDPDLTGAGHHPYGHNQWETLYRQYNVISSKLTARFFTVSGANLPVVCGAYMDKDKVLPLSLTTKSEQSKGRGLAILNANTNDDAIIRAVYDRDKWFSKKSQEYENQQVLFGNNPASDATCEVWVQTVDGATAAATSTHALIRIDYYVELSEPIEFGAST